MKRAKTVLATIVLLLLSGSASAQFSALSFNVLGYASGNINAAVDLRLDAKRSFNIPLSVSPVAFTKTGWANVTLAPGVRFWNNEIYHGGFVGLYAIVSAFDFRYAQKERWGWCTGAGVSYGTAILLSKRWNLELELGLGVVYSKYSLKELIEYGPFDDEEWSRRNSILLVPSRTRVTFAYLF